ncbi:MAG: hypothetical protein ACLU4J_27545 [Butyricimonas paravirosa]
MNFYEFASDLWGAVFWEHHFKGFSEQNSVDETAEMARGGNVKGFVGTLSDKNNGSSANTDAIFRFPEDVLRVKALYRSRSRY